jgi:leucyl/phenylalanyl-tRNA---protein transferase
MPASLAQTPPNFPPNLPPNPSPNLPDVLTRYATGWFPLFDDRGTFFWERPDQRAILPLTPDTRARARRLAKRGQKRFAIRFTTAVDPILAQLQRVRPNNWVKGEVVEIYRALHAAGILRTVEAWSADTLAGGLLGLVLPGVFVAETMYGTVSEASKTCLCRLVEECTAAGFELIDVQMPHDETPDGRLDTEHPCVRLGEVRLAVDEFLGLVEGAWRSRFSGDANAWIDLCRQRQEKTLHGLW